MLERRVTLVNELGLHARAAAQVVRGSRKFISRITLRREETGVEADAGSILDILYLAAGRGKNVILVADGQDEAEALEALERLFLDGFGEK